MAHFVFSSFATVIWPSIATFCNDEHSKPCIDKVKTVVNAPNKDSAQPVHQQSLIKVFTVCQSCGWGLAMLHIESKAEPGHTEPSLRAHAIFSVLSLSYHCSC